MDGDLKYILYIDPIQAAGKVGFILRNPGEVKSPARRSNWLWRSDYSSPLNEVIGLVAQSRQMKRVEKCR